MPTPLSRRFRFSLRSLILLVAIAGSGYGLWIKWEPWTFSYEAKRGYGEDWLAIFSNDGRYLIVTDMNASGNFVFDAETGRFKGKNVGGSGKSIFTCGSRHLEYPVGDVVKIRDRLSKEVIYRILPHHSPIYTSFSPDCHRIAVTCAKSVVVYRRRRPEYWWGVAWLPEFWLTLVLTTALLWSLRQNRLNLKTAAEPNLDQPQSSDGPEAVG